MLQHRGSLWFSGSKLCSRPGGVAHHDRFVGWHGALCSQGTRPGAVNAINGARLACQELGTRGGPQPCTQKMKHIIYFMEKINLLCSLLSLLLKNLHHLIHMSDSLGTTSSMDSATGVSDACHTGSILV